MPSASAKVVDADELAQPTKASKTKAPAPKVNQLTLKPLRRDDEILELLEAQVDMMDERREKTPTKFALSLKNYSVDNLRQYCVRHSIVVERPFGKPGRTQKTDFVRAIGDHLTKQAVEQEGGKVLGKSKAVKASKQPKAEPEEPVDDPELKEEIEDGDQPSDNWTNFEIALGEISAGNTSVVLRRRVQLMLRCLVKDGTITAADKQLVEREYLS